MREYYVYIMTGRCGIFYTGVTNNLLRHVAEHKAGQCEFTGRYRINRLVYLNRPMMSGARSRAKSKSSRGEGKRRST